MGVPGFFAWIMKNWKKKEVVLSNINIEVDTFYIDANCLFHPCCFKVLNYYQKEINPELLEKKMFKRITNFIDYLIGYVNPKTKVFISVDGVAPMAKINQQRNRRFKSVYDEDVRKGIKNKHDKQTYNEWSNTVITPGTAFMERLHQVLIQYIKSKKNIKIEYSSYHSAGEGEHKILQDIRNRKTDNNSKAHVIYGLDADLIFLALASQRKNVFLLREEVEFGKKEKKDDIIYNITDDVAETLCFVNIDTLKELINEEMLSLINKKRENDQIEKINLINDFIFICYLLGNDFLPHLPSIDIKTNGIDLLLDSYTDTYNSLDKQLLEIKNRDIYINDIFLDTMLKKVCRKEDFYFKEIYPKYKAYLAKRKCYATDPFEIEMWKLDNMVLFEVDDPIKLGEDAPEVYKFRYYDHHFNASEHQEELVTSACHEYLKGLMWVTKYYFDDCPSWNWQYPYIHAPFLSDISTHLTQHTDLNEIKFDKSDPLLPCVQLLIVLPPHCNHILPKSYQFLTVSGRSPIIDMYPKKIKLDMINKESYFKCDPKIPIINIDRVHQTVKSLKLTNEEKIRNSLQLVVKNYNL